MSRTAARGAGPAFATLIVAVLATTVAAAQPAGDEDAPIDAELEALLGEGSASEPPPDAGEPTPDGDGDGDGDVAVEAPPVRDPKLARKLRDGAAKFVKKADRLLKRKKVAEAHEIYRRAIEIYDKAFELDPAAVTLLTAGALEEKLELWYEAARRYERALAETEQPLDDKGRARAQEALDRTKLYLGVLVVTVVPEGATVTLDGTPLGEAPLPTPLLLKPGEYTLALAMDGFVAFETKLVIEAGSESERTFELEPVPVVVEKPRPPPPPPPPPLPPAPKKTVLYASAGATLGLLVGATVTGVLAVGEHGTFTDESLPEDERDAAQSSGKRMALLSDVFTAGTVVAAGFTAYYYLKVYKPKAAERSAAEREREGWHDELSIVPVIDRDGGGLSVVGSF